MRYLQIQVKGYRALADVTLDLHPLTVMIGPNGCGKTSLLEVFQLLREAAQGRLGEAITNLGGFMTLLTCTSGAPARMEFVLKADINSQRSPEPISYHLTLEPGPQGVGFVSVLERLWQLKPGTGPHRYIDSNTPAEPELKLSTWPPEGRGLFSKPATEPEVFRDALTKTLSLGSLDVSPRAPVRLPQTLTPATYPGKNGESLFPALYNMRESKASRSSYERVEETLQLAFPDFDHLELPVVGGGQVTLAWYEKNLTIPLYPNQLSEGTLRFLWLTTVLLSPEPPPLILIDEPEVSLHPEFLKILAALLQDASARTQLLVATHSSDLIRWLQPDEVVVIDKEEAKSAFIWANDSSLNLSEWLKHYTLSDLWLMGNLGGRP